MVPSSDAGDSKNAFQKVPRRDGGGNNTSSTHGRREFRLATINEVLREEMTVPSTMDERSKMDRMATALRAKEVKWRARTNSSHSLPRLKTEETRDVQLGEREAKSPVVPENPLQSLSTATKTHACARDAAAHHNNNPSPRSVLSADSLCAPHSFAHQSEKSIISLSSGQRPGQKSRYSEPTFLRLSHRTLSISALETILRSTNAQYRLALMLALPWRTAAFWTVTGSSIGCFYVARLLLPRLRLYAVFLGRGLASLLVTPPSLGQQLQPPSRAHPLTDSGALQRAWLTVLAVVAPSSLPLDSSPSLPSPSPTLLRPSTPPRSVPVFLPRTPLPRTPERAVHRSPYYDWDSPLSAMDGAILATSPQSSSTNSPSRSRADSGAEKPPTKRFSLNFPIQVPNTTPRPPSWHASPIMSPEIIPSPTEGNFLTILAGQERRVLELKEDLRRAEEELERLKKHWAKHEIHKKSQDTRRLGRLQPLRTNFATPGADNDGLQREMDRRKSLLGNSRVSNRKVFSGSRHARTLSLLSPDKGNDAFTDSPFKKPASRISLERSTTSPDLKPIESPNKEDIFADITGVPKEAILRTGKQMVGDIKDGFWTFVEDIRQAAVGNEPINGQLRVGGSVARHSQHGRSKSQRTPSSYNRMLHRHSVAHIATAQLRSTTTMAYDAESNSFWRENGVESPASNLSRSTATTVRQADTPTPAKDADEAWDMWGSPTRLPASHGASNSLSSTNTNATARSASPSSDAGKAPALSTGRSSPTSNTTLSTPDMANSFDESDDVWPKQLTKLVNPNAIKKTASSRVPDWEKSLSAGAEDAKKAEKQD